MSTVHLAFDSRLERYVAIKLLAAHLADDPNFVSRFRREALAAARLVHPNIVQVFDFGFDPGHHQHFIVMEHVSGNSCAELLRDHGHMSVQEALDVVTQACRGLDYAHRNGVVHRDVKPGNLLVRPDGTVKVTDFGIARAADGVPLTQTGTVLGTAYYLSPEQGSGRPVGPSSDVYSLGVVAYECLTGGRPFAGTNAVAVALAHVRDQPPALPDDIPPPVRTLIDQTLEKEPSRRPDSAGTFGRTALALREALYGQSPSTGPMATTVAGVAAAGDTRAVTSLLAPTGLLAGKRVPAAAEHRRRNLLLLAGLVGVLLLTLLLHACGSGSKPTVAVPDVTGKPVADARAALSGQSLRVEEKPGNDTGKPVGTVLAQDPKAGQQVSKDSAVMLTIASGPSKVNLDPAQYVGKPVATVSDQLKSLGFGVTVQNAGSGGAPGTVSSLTPTGQLTPGAMITVVAVSQPSAPAPAPAPGKKGSDKKGGGGGND
ncbi:MAG: protein kinase [Actinomycetota bacterium]|nr:protein kinase [Actinomycetota bacterium]